MVIRSIEVENWRCIQRVQLQDLSGGVVVVHGPNRSGKSSLFEAVRCCLYDYHHDSASQAIAGVVPWSTKETPKVVVDFESGGARYRITKVFSRGREGTAFLERWADGGWVADVREPKEASRRVRELLGAEKALAGLNQLLWLPQGQTELPCSSELDKSLEKRLESVLGTLVTGQDLEFREVLHRRCGRWFTAKRMEHREGSPVKELRGLKQQREDRLLEVTRKLDDMDGLVRQFEEAEAEIRRIRKEVDQAKTEASALEEERDKSRERREAHRKAREASRAAGERVRAATQAVERYSKAKGASLTAEKELRDAQEKFDGVEEQLQALTAEHGRAQETARKAREAEDEHTQGQAELRDREKLIDAQEALADLEEKLEEGRGYEQEIEKHEELMAEKGAPSEKELKDLRGTAEQIRELRSRLEAAGIRLRVTPEKELTLRVSVDAGRARPVKAPPKGTQEWLARQRIEARIAGIGTVEVSRGAEDLDLEEAAGRLEQLEREYQEEVERWAEDPTSTDALDHLAERRIRREGWAQDLKKAKKDLQQLAPNGLPAMELEKEQRERIRESIINRRFQLSDWVPDQQELDELTASFEKEAKRLARQRKEAEECVQALGDRLVKLRAHLEDVRGQATEKRVFRDRLQGQLETLGDPDTLEAELTAANAAKERAEEQVAETALTEAEHTIDERLEAAREALEKREERLRKAEDRLNQYRGELRGAEGLHTERVRIEQELNAVTRRLEREELEADAHALLLKLFDECRDAHVHRTMHPIAGRVLDWARHLGLDEYTEVSFAEGYVPDGLVRSEAAPDEQPVRLKEESFGTGEQLALLVRLALGNLLAQDEPQVAILDDPLAHADSAKHQRMLDVLKWAAEGTPSGYVEEQQLGKLQVFVLTCHPERFDYLTGATQVDFLEAQRP